MKGRAAAKKDFGVLKTPVLKGSQMFFWLFHLLLRLNFTSFQTTRGKFFICYFLLLKLITYCSAYCFLVLIFLFV